MSLRVLAFQDQKLGHHVVGGRVIDLDAEEDDAVFKQLRVGVLALESVAGALFEAGQNVAGFGHKTIVHNVLPDYFFPCSVPPPPITSLADARMWSTKPYSRA